MDAEQRAAHEELERRLEGLPTDEEEIDSSVERMMERVRAARETWQGDLPETKEEALAILEPLMRETAKDLTDSLVRVLVRSAVKKSIEMAAKAEEN